MPLSTENLRCDAINSIPVLLDLAHEKYDYDGDAHTSSEPENKTWTLAEEIRDGGDPEDEDYDPDAYMPVMSFGYPVDNLELPENWQECLCNMTVAKTGGQTYLVLTGGGMDFSWEIAETFIRLGFQPPVCISELPAMAGRGKSEDDKIISRACMRSLEIQAGWAQSKLSRMRKRYST